MSYSDDDVKIRSRGEWHMSMDGTTETRVNFGRSAEGHHFQIERSRFGGDSEPGWSRAYRTSEAAEHAASLRSWGTDPDREPSDRERFRERVEKALEERGPPPSAAVARALENAAYHRQIGLRDEARTDIADARQYRLTQHDSVRVVDHRPMGKQNPDQERVRVVFGRSAEGHHFRIEGPRNEGSVAPWSPAFDTRSGATREAYRQAYHAPESHRVKTKTASENPSSEGRRAGNTATEAPASSAPVAARGADVSHPATAERAPASGIIGWLREQVAAVSAGVQAYHDERQRSRSSRDVSAGPAAGTPASPSKRPSDSDAARSADASRRSAANAPAARTPAPADAAAFGNGSRKPRRRRRQVRRRARRGYINRRR
jgi:hypothetical protein